MTRKNGVFISVILAVSMLSGCGKEIKEESMTSSKGNEVIDTDKTNISDKNEEIEKVEETPYSIFGDKIINCVKNDKRKELASMIVFPDYFRINNLRVKIKNEEEFLKRYDEIFNEEFKNIIANCNTVYEPQHYMGAFIGSNMRNIWYGYYIIDGKEVMKIMALNNEEVAINQNYIDEYREWDSELNRVYNMLRGELEDWQRDYLLKAQMGWLKYHIKESEFLEREFEGHRIHEVDYAVRMRRIQRRVESLVLYERLYVNYEYQFVQRKMPREEGVVNKWLGSDPYDFLKEENIMDKIRENNSITDRYNSEMHNIKNNSNDPVNSYRYRNLVKEIIIEWDNLLNEAYMELKENLDEESFQILKESQVGWLEYHINEALLLEFMNYREVDVDKWNIYRLRERTLELLQYCYYKTGECEFFMENS